MTMRIIFDLGHPAHFHLFKNVILKLKRTGNNITIIARKKDCLVNLLELSGLDYILIDIKGNSLFKKLIQNFKAFKAIYSIAKLEKTDLIIGTSLVAPYVAKLTKAKSVIFSEDDADIIPVFKYFVYPLADYIVTPDSLDRENHGKKHLRYHGYHELAYLHPARFIPDPSIKKQMGLDGNEKFYFIRLVSLTAHHDIGQKGLSTEQALLLVDKLKKHGRVFISAEKPVEKQLESYLLKVSPDKIFDVLSAAEIVIGDSQTMILESAVLGTPAIRCNTFVGRLSVLEELENKYELAAGFLPTEFDMLLALLDNWLETDNLKNEWDIKRKKMLSECVDLTNWIIEMLTILSGDKECQKAWK